MSSLSMNTSLEKHISIITNGATSRPDFRKSVKKISEWVGFKTAEHLFVKITKNPWDFEESSYSELVKEGVVIIAILRSGLIMLEGFLKAFPQAPVGFLSVEDTAEDAVPTYQKIPKLLGKTVIIINYSILPNNNMMRAIKIIKSLDAARIIIGGIFKTKNGVYKITQYDINIPVVTFPMAPGINELNYLIPGAGKAEERAFGKY